MTNSRRRFLKIASAGVAVTRLGVSATSEPTVGLIFPPANYPMPPEVHKMYPSGIRFPRNWCWPAQHDAGRL